jgi:prepilin-type N-terminal cleavage/methylation domain-containing protein
MEAKNMINLRRTEKSRSTSRGFTLLEMMCATVILLVALFAVAQLVPASINLNSQNRSDSAALVFAQRQLEQLLEQPLSAPSFTDPQTGDVYNLGNAATPNTLVGNPVAINDDGLSMINFGGSQIPGYSLNYPDPTSAGATLDVRWAVITSVNGTIVTGKRFIVGVRRQGGNGFFLPVTLDSAVAK